MERRQVELLLYEALQRPIAERDAFLREACASDSELYRQVQSLLRNHCTTADHLLNSQTIPFDRIGQGTQPQPGQRVGPYEILSFLAKGGMGAVYRAKDPRMGREVAIKFSEVEFARFSHEVRAIAALNHPNICTLYDVGPNYLVMELVLGSTLTERLAQGTIPAKEGLIIAKQIAAALEVAHANGIVHRDLKPGNIKIRPDGLVKVLDFGLAKILGGTAELSVNNTQPGTIVGTAPYMSPEQVQGKPADERSDIFSFGAILYELLSGTRAFAGNSLGEVLSAVMHDDPPPLQAPATLQRIVMRCLAKQPKERFQRMSEVNASLAAPSHQPADEVPSIAILPFVNLSADKENEYFSDGLAEEIINILAQIRGLKVTARTSSFAFRGKEQDIRRIAEALAVRNLVQGSVRRAGSRIRVTAQLINAKDGYHLWSERYERDMADLFAMQDEIAQAIGAALQVKLSVESGVPSRYTPNIAAYEAFLKAVYHGGRLTPDSLALNRKYLEQAIELDPKFALAYSAFGSHLFVLACGTLQSADEAIPAARAAAQKALDLDPRLPEAQALLGVISAVYDYDWKEAERRFRLAMSREPIPPHVRHSYGFWYLVAVGRLQEAVEECAHGLEKDPLSVLCHTNLGYCLLMAGRDEEAGTEFHKALELDTNSWFAAHLLAVKHALQGTMTEALGYAEKAHSLAPWYPDTIGLLAALLERIGNAQRAETLLEKLKPTTAFGVPRGLTVFHSLWGDAEKAADWTEKAIEQRDPAIPLFIHSPLLKALSHARWSAIARRVNLPEDCREGVAHN